MKRITAETASDALAEAGLRFPAKDLAVERRDDRFLVRLPGDRIAWFAASRAGRRKISTEGRVLRLLAERCRFRAPRVLLETDTFQVRDMVPGVVEPWALFAKVKEDPAQARRIGRELGVMLAEQHTRIAREPERM